MNPDRVVITTGPVLRGAPQNGLTTVLENTAARGEGRLLVLSGDPSSGTLGGAPVIGVGCAHEAPGIRQRWHNLGYWQLLHEDAFTRPVLSDDGVEALWDSAVAPFGERDQLRRFIDAHIPSLEIECAALERFQAPIEECIPEGAAVSLQDFSCAQLLRVFRDTFLRKGCSVELHHHGAWGEHMGESRTGRELIEAYSFADTVHVHTERYRRDLAAQLPSDAATQVKTFEIGVNYEKLRHGSEGISSDNYRATIPSYELLSPQQKKIVEEIFCTEHTVPHRFICIDRIDAIKGNLTVFDGVRCFLDQELRRTGSLELLGQTHRFFFLYTARASQLQGDYPLWTRYARHAERRLAALQEDFPGVVHIAPGLEGVQSVAIGALLRNQTLLSGGAHDGLNLSCMESAVVNRGKPQSIIIGRGAGFADVVCSAGREELAYFPAAGDAAEFCRSIETVCEMQRTAPQLLAERTAALVDSCIKPRGEADV